VDPRRFLPVAAIAAFGLLGGAGATSAHTLVDPTTLTPPLPATWLCQEDGPWVRCDRSVVFTISAEDTGDPGCGTVYQDSTDSRHTTRWYRHGPVVALVVQSNVLRIEGMGSLARDVGIWLPDGTHHGLFSLGDEGDAALCALLVQ
jgi:hypothetical protein